MSDQAPIAPCLNKSIHFKDQPPQLQIQTKQVGGLLFLPLSWEVLDADRATRALRSFCECVRRQYADEEVVVISEIFPHGAPSSCVWCEIEAA